MYNIHTGKCMCNNDAIQSTLKTAPRSLPCALFQSLTTNHSSGNQG